MILPENTLGINIRLYDLNKNVKLPVGVYQNVTTQDLNIEEFFTDVRKAMNQGLKQLKVELTNAKKGEDI